MESNPSCGNLKLMKISEWEPDVKTGDDYLFDPSNVLPHDVLLSYIFSFFDLEDLCLCRRVSKTWKSLVEEYLGRAKQLDFAPVQPIITSVAFESFIKHARNLTVLRLDYCWTCTTEENLKLVAKTCHKLCELSVMKCKGVTDNALVYVTKRCRDLQQINIISCYQVTDKGVMAIARNCPKLTDLHVSSNYGVTDKSLIAVAEGCPLLQELDVGRCPYITDGGLRPFVAGKCTLKLLRITKCARVSHEMIMSLICEGVAVNNMF